jgi:hypothetical protein
VEVAEILMGLIGVLNKSIYTSISLHRDFPTTTCWDFYIALRKSLQKCRAHITCGALHFSLGAVFKVIAATTFCDSFVLNFGRSSVVIDVLVMVSGQNMNCWTSHDERF